MDTLSTKTLGVITEVAKEFRASEIKTMLMVSGLSDGDPSGEPNKSELVRQPLLNARKRASTSNDAKAHEALLEFARCLAEALSSTRGTYHHRLEEALRSDGYELQITPDLPTGRNTCRILPSEPPVAPLNPEMTAFEAELDSRGYKTALGHYQSAIKNFAEQDHPASNGQLRCTLESLVVSLAVDHTGYIDTGKANQGTQAIKTLNVPLQPGQPQPPCVLGQPLPEQDGGALLRGVWGISHLNGSHPGLSDAQEARIRMQLVTALGQLLLRHFPPKP
jgi:hypothetical protein